MQKLNILKKTQFRYKMARDFKKLIDKFDIYFFNSQSDMVKTVEDYLTLHPNEVNMINSSGTSDSSIRSDAEFYGYDKDSPLSIAEQYSYDQLKMFSDMPLLTEAIEKFDIIKRGLDLGGDFDASKMKFTSLHSINRSTTRRESFKKNYRFAGKGRQERFWPAATRVGRYSERARKDLKHLPIIVSHFTPPQ